MAYNHSSIIKGKPSPAEVSGRTATSDAREKAIPDSDAVTVEMAAPVGREETLLKAGALQSAIFNSANFSSFATDEKGVIQIFNVGAQRMLGNIKEFMDTLNEVLAFAEKKSVQASEAGEQALVS